MSAVVRARLPEAYVAALARLGGNQSAALRACVLLALGVLGGDLTPFASELTRGGLAGLTPATLTAVQQALEGCTTGVPQVYHSSADDLVADADDPFAGIGIEV